MRAQSRAGTAAGGSFLCGPVPTTLFTILVHAEVTIERGSSLCVGPVDVSQLQALTDHFLFARMQQSVLHRQCYSHAAYRHIGRTAYPAARPVYVARHRHQQQQQIISRAESETGNSTAGPITEPTERVLKLWREANCVCFDVDCKDPGKLVLMP